MDFPTSPTLHPLPPGTVLIGPGLTGATINPELITADHLLCMVTCIVDQTTYSPKGDMVLKLKVHPADKAAAFPMTDIIGHKIQVGFWANERIIDLYTPPSIDPHADGIGPGRDGTVGGAKTTGVAGAPRKAARPGTRVQEVRARIKMERDTARFMESLRDFCGPTTTYETHDGAW